MKTAKEILHEAYVTLTLGEEQDIINAMEQYADQFRLPPSKDGEAKAEIELLHKGMARQREAYLKEINNLKAQLPASALVKDGENERVDKLRVHLIQKAIDWHKSEIEKLTNHS